MFPCGRVLYIQREIIYLIILSHVSEMNNQINDVIYVYLRLLITLAYCDAIIKIDDYTNSVLFRLRYVTYLKHKISITCNFKD